MFVLLAQLGSCCGKFRFVARCDPTTVSLRVPTSCPAAELPLPLVFAVASNLHTWLYGTYMGRKAGGDYSWTGLTSGSHKKRAFTISWFTVAISLLESQGT